MGAACGVAGAIPAVTGFGAETLPIGAGANGAPVGREGGCPKLMAPTGLTPDDGMSVGMPEVIGRISATTCGAMRGAEPTGAYAVLSYSRHEY